jgi:hypothetical protein
MKLIPFALVTMIALPAVGLETLSQSGSELAPARGPVVERSVDLGADQPITSFAVARVAGVGMLQWTPSGAWRAWDGNPASLVDLRLTPGIGTMTWRVPVDGPGVEALIIGYRAPDGLKYGVLAVEGGR